MVQHLQVVSAIIFASLAWTPIVAAQHTELPEILDAIDPRDIETTRYHDRHDDIAFALGIDPSVLTESNPLVRPQLPSWPDMRPSLPVHLLRTQHDWEFDIERFSMTTAVLKSVARRILSADSLAKLLQQTENDNSEFESLLTRRIPVVDSLSWGAYKMPVLSAKATRRFIRKVVSESYGAKVTGKTTNGADTVFTNLSLSFCNLRSAERCIGDPVLAWPLSTHFASHHPLSAQIVVPIENEGSLIALVSFGAYTGRYVSHSAREVDLSINSPWPHTSLVEAKRLVEEFSDELATAAIYTSSLLSSDNALLVAVSTESGNVFLVDPIIQLVW